MREQATLERVRERLAYDPDSGLLTWASRPSRKIRIGQQAGRIGTNGYVVIRLDGLNYHAHRLAWLLHHGVWPAMEIDHINGERADNRIANLRDVDRSTNMSNRKGADRDARTGVLGVYKHRQRFVAQRRIHGVHRYLGTFDTAAAAGEAYKAALQKEAA